MWQLPWLFHDLTKLADLVFIIVDHDEVVRTAEQHGAGEASLYTNALGYVNDNRVIIFWSQYAKTWRSSQY